MHLPPTLLYLLPLALTHPTKPASGYVDLSYHAQKTLARPGWCTLHYTQRLSTTFASMLTVYSDAPDTKPIVSLSIAEHGGYTPIPGYRDFLIVEELGLGIGAGRRGLKVRRTDDTGDGGDGSEAKEHEVEEELRGHEIKFTRQGSESKDTWRIDEWGKENALNDHGCKVSR